LIGGLGDDDISAAMAKDTLYGYDENPLTTRRAS